MTSTPPWSPNPLVTKLELFARLSSADKEAIENATNLRVRDVAAHEDIIREGESPDHVNLVLSGWACRYKQLEDGRRQTLAYFLPGDLCEPQDLHPEADGPLDRRDHASASCGDTA